jgi:predicted site-specific integrase-resolvase
MNQDLITPPEAAEILGVSLQAVHKRIANGSIKPLGRLGGIHVLSRPAIERLKEEIGRERYR